MNAGEGVAIVFWVLSMIAAVTVVSGDWVAPTEAATLIKAWMDGLQGGGHSLKLQGIRITNAFAPSKDTLRLYRIIEKAGSEKATDEITFKFISAAKGYATSEYKWTTDKRVTSKDDGEVTGTWLLKFTGYRKAFEEKFADLLRVKETKDADAKGQPNVPEEKE